MNWQFAAYVVCLLTMGVFSWVKIGQTFNAGYELGRKHGIEEASHAPSSERGPS